MLEALVPAKKARQNPFLVFLYSFFTSSVALWTSFFLVPSLTSILTISFASIITVAFFRRIIGEEAREIGDEVWLTMGFSEKYGDLLTIYFNYFMGAVVSFTTWYVLLPQEMVRIMFYHQRMELVAVESLRASLTPSLIHPSIFFFIFFHNLRIMLLMLLLSFLFGSGAVFLITWNASVLSVYLGSIAKETFLAHVKFGPLVGFLAFSSQIFISAVSLVPHGFFELASYFVAAISGAVLSVGVERKSMECLKHAVLDGFKLLVIAVALLILAAFIESLAFL